MSRIVTWESADHGTSMEPNEKILFFDGVCNLCNGLVKFIIRQDKLKRIKFAQLQSEFAQKQLAEYGVGQADSVIYISGNRLFSKSAAILQLLRDIGGAWKLLYGFIFIPRSIRDFIYDIIARNRYRIFGRRETCMVPAPGVKERFL